MEVTQEILPLPASLSRLRWVALVAAVIGWAGCLAGMSASPAQFYSSYLWVYLLCLGLSLGSLALVMLNRLTGGQWGLLIRRPAEAAALNLPLMAIFFIPILMGMKHLFPWAIDSMVQADAVLKRKSAYLNPYAFTVRATIYFIFWLLMLTLQIRGGNLHDRNGQNSTLSWLRRCSSGGLVIFFLTITLATVDWVMSREAHWVSTVLGLLVAVGEGLTAMAFLIVILNALSQTEPIKTAIRADILNDLGNLLFTLVILWAYTALAQFLITWMGNLQEEIPWYLHRTSGGWHVIAGSLIALHFFAPFILLLFKFNKRRIDMLAKIAGGVLIMRVVDLLWQVRPSDVGLTGGASGGIYWTDLFTPLAIGGPWLFLFLWHLGRRTLLPLKEPDVHEMLNHVEHGAAAHGAAHAH